MRLTLADSPPASINIRATRKIERLTFPHNSVNLNLLKQLVVAISVDFMVYDI